MSEWKWKAPAMTKEVFQFNKKRAIAIRVRKMATIHRKAKRSGDWATRFFAMRAIGVLASETIRISGSMFQEGPYRFAEIKECMGARRW